MSQRIRNRSSKSWSWIVRGTAGCLALSMSGLPAIAAEVAKDLYNLQEIPESVKMGRDYAYPGDDVDLDDAQKPLASSDQEKQKGLVGLNIWQNPQYPGQQYASLTIKKGTALPWIYCSFEKPIYERVLSNTLKSADETKNIPGLPGFQRHEANFNNLNPDEQQGVLSFVLSQLQDSFVLAPVIREEKVSTGFVANYSGGSQDTYLTQYDVDPKKVREGGAGRPQEIPLYESVFLPDVIGCRQGADSDPALSKVCETLRGSPYKPGSLAERTTRPNAVERKRLGELIAQNEPNSSSIGKFIPPFDLTFYNWYNPGSAWMVRFSSNYDTDRFGVSYREGAIIDDFNLRFDATAQSSQVPKDARIATAGVNYGNGSDLGKYKGPGLTYDARSVTVNGAKVEVTLPVYVSQRMSPDGRGGGVLKSNFKGVEKMMPPYTTKMLEALKIKQGLNGWSSSPYSPFPGYQLEPSMFKIGASYNCVGLPGSGRTYSHAIKQGLSREALLNAAGIVQDSVVEQAAKATDSTVLNKLKDIKQRCDSSMGQLNQELSYYNMNRPSGLADSINGITVTDAASLKNILGQQDRYVSDLSDLQAQLSAARDNDPELKNTDQKLWSATAEKLSLARDALTKLKQLSDQFAQVAGYCNASDLGVLGLLREVRGAALSIDAAQKAIENFVASLDGDSGKAYDAGYLKLMQTSGSGLTRANDQVTPPAPQGKLVAPEEISIPDTVADPNGSPVPFTFKISNEGKASLAMNSIQPIGTSFRIKPQSAEARKLVPGEVVLIQGEGLITQPDEKGGLIQISTSDPADNGKPRIIPVKFKVMKPRPAPKLVVSVGGSCMPKGKEPGKVTFTVENAVPESVLTLSEVKLSSNNLSSSNLPQRGQTVLSGKPLQFDVACKAGDYFENYRGEVSVSSDGGNFTQVLRWNLIKPEMRVAVKGSCASQKVGKQPSVVQVSISNAVPNSVLELAGVESSQPARLVLNNPPEAGTVITSDQPAEFSVSCSTAQQGNYNAELRVRAKNIPRGDFRQTMYWKVTR